MVGVNTLGVTLSYGIETTAGTRPTGTFTKIPGIKSIPDIGASASALDATTLEETYSRQYIPGLKDVGGILSFTANNTNEFQSAWNTLVTAAETAEASNLTVWFEIVIPKITNKFVFKGMPIELGLNGMGVDEVAEVTANIAPSKVEGWTA